MKKIKIIIFMIILTLTMISAYDIQSPPMGWLSWNLFEGDINAQLVKEIANAMVETGMRDAGYEYIVIDDLWQGGRDENGKIVPDPKKFPNGMKEVADYVHSKDLKLGIYTDVAKHTCAGKTGSWGHINSDVATFAEWGIDYIKVDYCWAPKDLFSAIERYKKFGQAMDSVERNMVYSICEWGQRSPWLWGDSVGGDLWRTTWDIRDIWEHGKYDNGHNGIMECLDRQVGLHRFTEKGNYNDPDMLVVGLYGEGKSASINNATGCTTREYRSQMSLWCLLSAPLMACNDIRNMDDTTKKILTNSEVIAINQDSLSRQARRIYKENEKEIWAKPLADGSWAVGFLNRDDNITQEISLNFTDINLKSGSYTIRDLWKHENIAVAEKSFSCEVKPHQVRLVKISKN